MLRAFSGFAAAILLLISVPLRAAPIDDRLARGVNLTLAQATAHESEGAGPFLAPADSDIAIIQSLGMGHVRVRVNPEQFISEDGKLIEDEAQHLLSVLHDIQKGGLAIILTMQPPPTYKHALKPGSAKVEEFAGFWKALAGKLKILNENWLAFEPLNEPEHETAEAWFTVQSALVKAVRSAAPKHRIVVAGHKFSSIPELITTRKLPYDNLSYSFHFYDPHNFTHQGAVWGWPMWQQFHDWPYPSSPAAVAEPMKDHTLEARPHLEYYGSQNWNRSKLAAELDKASDWAKRNNVELLCTEFGVYRDGVEQPFRIAWLSDVRELLEERGIGWSLWNYGGNFGLVSGPPGERIVDIQAVQALGL